MNELDWWIASQWEMFKIKEGKTGLEFNKTDKEGNVLTVDRTQKWNKLRAKTDLKEMYIVRYADDFKLFCRDYATAKKVMCATKLWLAENLHLQTSGEKSGITNLRKNYTTFLGIKFKVVPKGSKWVIRSHMADKSKAKVIKKLKILCRIGVPIGLLIGGLAGYLLQPDGWDWIAAVFWGIIISLIINFVVKVSLNRPTKIALSISPILSSKYMMERFDCKVTNKEKRKLSSLGLAIISITSHWKSILVSVLSLGLSGLLFVLAATYTASIDPESIVKKDVYQYGQFAIETTGKYSEKVSEIENFKQKIMEFPSISNIKQVVETDISWAGKNSTGKDQLSIITANDFASIQQFSESGDLDYQQLVQSNQIVAVNGVEGISKGDTVEFTFGDGTQKIYTVGGILDGDLYSNTAIYGGWFLMPTELIAENSVSFNVSIRLIVKANDTGLEHTTISLEKLVDMSDGLTLTTMQEAIASKEATIRQVGISIIGVTLFLLLFSIITFASTIITNIATKKREYAMFQSIGMTRKQTEKMALCESCVLAIGSLILTLILGIILGQILIKGLISAGIFYLSYTFPLALFTVYCIVVVLIILMITISAFYSLQKTPLVERLRIVD